MGTCGWVVMAGLGCGCGGAVEGEEDGRPLRTYNAWGWRTPLRCREPGHCAALHALRSAAYGLGALEDGAVTATGGLPKPARLAPRPCGCCSCGGRRGETGWCGRC